MRRTHIVDGDEGIVNSGDSSPLRLSLTAHQASNAAKAVDANRNVTRGHGDDLALRLYSQTTSEPVAFADDSHGATALWGGTGRGQATYLSGLGSFVGKHLQGESGGGVEKYVVRSDGS